MKFKKGSKKFTVALASFVLVATLMFQFIVTPAQNVYAGPVDEAFSQTQREINYYLASFILKSCFVPLANATKGSADYSSFDTGFWQKGGQSALGTSNAGRVFVGEMSPSLNNPTDCNTDRDMNKVLDLIDLDIEGLMSYLYPRDNCNGDSCPARHDVGTMNNQGIYNLLLDGNKIQKVQGPDNAWELSEPALYNVMHREFFYGECKGRFSNDPKVEERAEKRYEKKEYYYSVNSETGQRDQYKYATFEINDDRAIGDTGLQRFFGGNDPTCKQLAAKKSDYAQAFANFIGDKRGACTGTNPPEYCAQPETTGSGNSAGGPDNTCESENVDSFGWIVCPALRTTVTFVSTAMGWFTDILDFSPVDEQRSVLEAVWRGFRSLANVGFVIAFLVVIYSAATGNLLSAYDVKKMLPRVLIGAIAVQLSFFITVDIMLAIANDLGNGAGRLLLAPLGNDSTTYLAKAAWGGIAGGIGTLVVGIAVLIGLIIAAIFSIIGILMMTIVFLIRNAAIMLLVVLSPVAFVAWILPSTESLFKKWSKFYIQILMIYPIATLFLASGQLIGAVWLGGTQGTGFTADNAAAHIFGLIAIFAPYFIAPKMFSLAGGAMQSIATAADNTKGSLGNKFGKVYNSEAGQRTRAKAGSGNLVSGNGRGAKIFNAAAAGVAAPGTLVGGKTMRMRARARQRSKYFENLNKDAQAQAYELDQQYLKDGSAFLESEFEAARQKGDEARMTAVARTMIEKSSFGSLERALVPMGAGTEQEREQANRILGGLSDVAGRKAPQIDRMRANIGGGAYEGKADELRLKNAIDVAGKVDGESIGGMHEREIRDLRHTLHTAAKAGDTTAQAALDDFDRIANDALLSEAGQKYSANKRAAIKDDVKAIDPTTGESTYKPKDYVDTFK